MPIDPMTGSDEWGMRSYQDKPDATRGAGRTSSTSTARSAATAPRRHEVPGLVARVGSAGVTGSVQVRSVQLNASAAVADGGFTLIEVLIVITLVVILASIGMATYTNSVHRAREAVLREDLFRMRDAIDQFYADKNKYPHRAAGSGDRRLSARDSQGSDDRFRRDVANDSRRARPDQPGRREPGIFNVKSGSEGVSSLDGTKYADW